jgi:hypothetical protein
MPSYAPGKFGTRALTGELRKLASEAITIEDDGTPVTREQMLAQMIWRQALGWVEKVRDDDGNLQEVRHPPVAWCQQFLFERTEGKAPQATQDERTGLKAADKVRELSKQRINTLSSIAKGPPTKPKVAHESV